MIPLIFILHKRFKQGRQCHQYQNIAKSMFNHKFLIVKIIIKIVKEYNSYDRTGNTSSRQIFDKLQVNGLLSPMLNRTNEFCNGVVEKIRPDSNRWIYPQ